MGLGETNFGPLIQEVETLASLYLYPISLRSWGMRVAVTADPTDSNNVVWVFEQGASSESKSDNGNWVTESFHLSTNGIVASHFRQFKRNLTPVAASTSSNSFLVPSTEIENGDTVMAIVTWVAKDVDEQKGAGGLFKTVWTKHGGAIAKVVDSSISNHTNAGNFTLSTANDGSGGIQITIATDNGNNFNASWNAEITIYKNT